MIYIGICDDETIHQIKNRDCCEQFFSGKNIDHSYIFFHSIFDVLSYSSHHISVLLLDIEMNDSINGVQLMHRLQHSRLSDLLYLYPAIPIMYMIVSVLKQLGSVQSQSK